MALTEIQLKICRLHGSLSQQGSRDLITDCPMQRLCKYVGPGTSFRAANISHLPIGSSYPGCLPCMDQLASPTLKTIWSTVGLLCAGTTPGQNTSGNNHG